MTSVHTPTSMKWILVANLAPLKVRFEGGRGPSGSRDRDEQSGNQPFELPCTLARAFYRALNRFLGDCSENGGRAEPSLSKPRCNAR